MAGGVPSVISMKPCAGCSGTVQGRLDPVSARLLRAAPDALVNDAAVVPSRAG
jgi:hypothetical protein